VVEALVDSQLRLGQSAIVDAVNAEEPGKAMWRGLARRHAVAMKIVECSCSDEAVHRERLQARHRGLELPEPTWADVERRRGAYTQWTESVFAVDALASLEVNLARVLEWLGERSA